MTKLIYNVKHLSVDEYKLWDDFVDNSDFGTPFHYSEYLMTTCKYLKLNFDVIAYINEENQILGGFAFGYLKKLKTIPILVNPYAICSNILTLPGGSKYKSKQTTLRNEIVSILLEKVIALYKNASFVFRPEETDFRPYFKYTRDVTLNYTYQLYIADIEEIYSKFNPEVKNKIRKAQKNNYILKVDDDINTFVSLQNQSFKRQGFNALFSDEQFYFILKSLLKYGKLKIYTLYNEKEPIASRAQVIHKHIAYDLMAGTNSEYIKLGVNQLLVWEIIKDLKTTGIKIFDFVGGNIETITSFKSAFNFDLKPTYHLTIKKGLIIKFLFLAKKIISAITTT